MKTTFSFLFILALSQIFVGCSSDSNNSNSNLPLTNENLLGYWRITNFIKPDGSLMPYVEECNVKKDTVTFFYSSYIKLRRHESDCIADYITADDIIINADTRKISSSNIIFDGTVNELTDQNMRIDYDAAVTSDPDLYMYTPRIGITLSRYEE